MWFTGGTLIFDEADIELQAENILITDGGVLQVWETIPSLNFIV